MWTQYLVVAFVLVALGSHVEAHGICVGITIGANDTVIPGFDPRSVPGKVVETPQRPADNAHTEWADYTSAQVATGGLKTSAPMYIQSTAAANAGDKIVIYYDQWPQPHSGPTMIYMANCGGSCGGIPGGDLDWFKIGQEGYHDGKWPNDRLLPSNKWAQYFTLPTNLPSGNYLVANHMLALHNVGEPQFYPVAYQINLKSSGTVDPQPKGRFPDIYLSGPQDFRTWNIYEEGPNNAAMKLPGIAVYKGSDAKIGDTGFNGAQDGVGAVAGKKQSDAPKKVTAVKAVVSSSTKKSATKSTSNPSSKATTIGKGGHGSPQVGALAKTGRPSDATGKEKGPSASIPKATTAISDKGQSMVTVTVTVYGSAPTAGAVDSQRSPEDEKTQGELKPSEEDDGSESASGQRALFLQTEDEEPSDEDDECESASGQRAPFLQAEHEEEGSDVDDECEDVSEHQVSLMKNEATGQRYRGRRSRMVPRHQRHHYKGSQAPSSPVSS